MSLGVTVGKFYPFHRGHELLLETALEQCDELAVVVAGRPHQEPATAVRAAWLRERFPQALVHETRDDLPEAPEPWAARTLELLGGRRPDLAFTSEEYGEPWARALGAQHVPVDLDRARAPASGTALRVDLGGCWGWLSAPARAHYARRVVVLGVESSGSTTLARDLAERLQTAWVPEYGRDYWEGRRFVPDAERWTSDELRRIAKGQVRHEEDLARQANRVLICDTCPLATRIWHRRYLGGDDPVIAGLAARRYDLALLTLPDFGFVQDGTRESEHLRQDMHAWFAAALEARGQPWLAVGGTRQERLTAALAAIEPLLSWDPLPDP